MPIQRAPRVCARVCSCEEGYILIHARSTYMRIRTPSHPTSAGSSATASSAAAAAVAGAGFLSSNHHGVASETEGERERERETARETERETERERKKARERELYFRGLSI